MKRWMIRLGQSLNMGMDKYTPDSFLFAVMLTFVIYLMGITLTPTGPFEMIQYWYKGFWGFLSFGMQMVLIIVTGYTLATTPLVSRLFSYLVQIPKTSLSASIFIFLATAILSFIHWGFGIVAGALLAPRLGYSVKKLDFKMLVASSYLGWCVGALGLTTSIALLANTPGNFLEKKIGLIPMAQTSLHPELLYSTLFSILIVAPFLLWLFHPEQADIKELDATTLARLEQEITLTKESTEVIEEQTFATWMENSPLISLLLSLMGLSFCAHWFATKGFELDLNFFNFLMLFLGIALHGTPRKFYLAFAEGIKMTWGVVLQFPFYAGIQGMMASSGLVPIMVSWFISISTPESFPFWTYISASIVNLFIPSSGGILMVQGPIMLDAGANLGISAPEVLRAFMAGEQISNVMQPFFAIPLLAMAGLKMKDIMGYSIIFFVVISIVYNISFVLS